MWYFFGMAEAVPYPKLSTRLKSAPLAKRTSGDARAHIAELRVECTYGAFVGIRAGVE